MSFVQVLKRLITTNDSSTSASGTTVNDTSVSSPETNASIHNSSANAIGPQHTMSTSKSNENFKPLSQGLQKKYARGVQYNSKKKFESFIEHVST
jgi:hypothetical protein